MSVSRTPPARTLGLLGLMLLGPALTVGGCDRSPAAADAATAAAATADAATAPDGKAPPPGPEVPPGLEAPPPPGPPAGPEGAGPPGDAGAGTMQAGLPQLSLEPVGQVRRQASDRALLEARQKAQGQGPGPVGPLRLAIYANPGNIEAWYELSTALKISGDAGQAEQAWDILFQIKEAGCARCLHLVRKAAYEAAWSDRRDDPRFVRLVTVDTPSARPYADARAVLGKGGQPVQVPARLVGAGTPVKLVRAGGAQELSGAAALNQALKAAKAHAWPGTQVACKEGCCYLVVDMSPVAPPTPPGSRPTRVCFKVPTEPKAPLQLERVELTGGASR